MIATFAERVAALRLAVYQGQSQTAIALAAALPSAAATTAIRLASLRLRLRLPPAPSLKPSTRSAPMVRGDDPDKLEQDE